MAEDRQFKAGYVQIIRQFQEQWSDVLKCVYNKYLFEDAHTEVSCECFH